MKHSLLTVRHPCCLRILFVVLLLFLRHYTTLGHTSETEMGKFDVVAFKVTLG